MSGTKSYRRTPLILLAFALAMIISIAAARPASAAVVDYSTTGVFTNSGTATSTSGADTLTYSSVSSTGNLTPSIISLGEFTLAGSDTDTFTDTFTVTISQIAPSSGTGDLSATVSGTLAVSSGTDSSSLYSTFTSTTVTIGTVTYTLRSNPVFVPDPLSNGGVVTIEASITSAVPLPAASWGGISLLGLIAVSKIRRAIIA